MFRAKAMKARQMIIMPPGAELTVVVFFLVFLLAHEYIYNVNITYNK